MPKIIIRQGQGAGTEVVLDGEKFTLGRRKACEIPIADGKSSRNHAQVFKQGTHFYVRDLASRNGTLLNGERLTGDSELSFGDKITIGDTVLEFVEESAGKPIDFEIPGYQIIERVGEGGMGVVYKARQVSMDRVVALKVLGEKYSANGEFIDRFIREARSAGKLNHPNVIHVHDVSKSGGRYFFSMEFVDGPSVKKLLKDSGRLPPAKTMEIVIQAAKALEFAHENGIIHRDVKPDNIMLTGEGIVKIADLGIAKSFEEGESAQVGSKRRVLGTPHYMAPEQAMGKALDRRADIYSLGATMYHMLTGTTPFKGTTVTELLKAHVHDKLEPVQHLNPDVPDAVCFVVERMMAKLPEKRYENMTRLLEDLERVQRDSANANIERLAPEDSTILRAVDVKAAAAAKAARANGGNQSPAPSRTREGGGTLKIVTAVVATLLVVALAAGAYLIVKKFTGQGGQTPGNGNTNTGTNPDPATSESARLLAEVKELQAAGKDDLAEAKAKDIVARFAGSTEAAEAAEIVKAIADRKAATYKAAAEAAIAAAEKVERDRPSDYVARNAAWTEVRAKFEGTPYADRAKDELDRIERLKNAADAAASKAEYVEAERKSAAALAAKDYLAATGVMTAFAAKFPKSAETPKATEQAKNIDAQADALLARAEKDSDEAIAAGEFERAVRVLKDLEASVKSAKWLPDIPKKTEAVKAKVKESFDRAYKLVEDQARAGRNAEATRAARDLLTRFKGTTHESQVTDFVEALSLQPYLTKKVLANVAKLGQKEITFKMEATLLPGKWFVSAADSERVTLVSPQLPGADSPLLWAKLSARDTYNLYLLYLDKPTADDHKALALFCSLRDMAAEAENHKKLAAGGN